MTSISLLLNLSFVPLAFGENAGKTISINTNGSKFVVPVLQKWTEEYRKEHPEITFKIVEQAEHSALSVVVSQQDAAETADQKIAFTGRYVLLPVSNPKNPFFKKEKGLNKKEVKDILFERDILEDDGTAYKDKYRVNVYSRVGKNGGTPVILANYFKTIPKRIKGKKLFGDEIYILNAIKKDSIGFAYTSLPCLYDLQTRELNPDLSLVPLNVKSKHREKLYSSNIDHVITLLETEEIELVPVEFFGFLLQETVDGETIAFVRWILSKGQQYNHELGFLKLDEQSLADQTGQLKDETLFSAK
ncbi:MAG: hypothetical protein LBR08_03365 [Bacteroidales bacterium]|nr:hypothetical protein [Bacteroidales bacterium]